MNQVFNSDVFVLVILTIIWSFFHSALISPVFIKFLKKSLDSKFRYYRIAYNLFSLVTFILVLLYEMTIKKEIIFDWNANFGVIRVFLFILTIALFYFGAQRYSFPEFIGLKQLNKQKINLTISRSGELDTSGIHKIIRHPWYLATLIIIWLRDVSISIICMNIILSAYLILGALLEEKKLVNEFGQAYLNYKKQVSMFIPFKLITARNYKNLKD